MDAMPARSAVLTPPPLAETCAMASVGCRLALCDGVTA